MPLPSGHAFCCGMPDIPAAAGPGMSGVSIAGKVVCHLGCNMGCTVFVSHVFFLSAAFHQWGSEALKRSLSYASGQRAVGSKKVFPLDNHRHGAGACEPLKTAPEKKPGSLSAKGGSRPPGEPLESVGRITFPGEIRALRCRKTAAMKKIR